MVVDMPMCNIYMKVVNKQQQKTSRLTLFFPGITRNTGTLFFGLEGQHNFKHFKYIHIVEIPTQKGESIHENVQSCHSNEKS